MGRCLVEHREEIRSVCPSVRLSVHLSVSQPEPAFGRLEPAFGRLEPASKQPEPASEQPEPPF